MSLMEKIIIFQVSGVGRAAELAAMVRERARLRGQLGAEAMARERAAAAAARERVSLSLCLSSTDPSHHHRI